jgi:hypothetical protein
MTRNSMLFLLLFVPAVALAPRAVANAAGMTGHTVTVKKTVGSYQLVLTIGLAETGMMMSGPKAMCSMSGMHLMREAAKMSACNHHVELHVYNAKIGKAITGLHVTIQIENSKHSMMMVPIDTMETGQKFHYGNNLYLANGKYTVFLQANATKTSFAVTLM